MKELALSIMDSADYAIGYEAAQIINKNCKREKTRFFAFPLFFSILVILISINKTYLFMENSPISLYENHQYNNRQNV